MKRTSASASTATTATRPVHIALRRLTTRRQRARPFGESGAGGGGPPGASSNLTAPASSGDGLEGRSSCSSAGIGFLQRAVRRGGNDGGRCRVQKEELENRAQDSGANGF